MVSATSGATPSSSITTMSRNTPDASPRGPNQPMSATVGHRNPVPASAIATAAIRTTVRLRTA